VTEFYSSHHEKEDGTAVATDQGMASSISIANPAKINMARLHDISDGDLNFQQEMIDLFEESCETGLAQLEGFLSQAAPDLHEAALKAHELKGVSANVGAEAFSAVSLEMESCCKAGNFDEARKLLAKMWSEFVEANNAYHAL